MFKNRSKSSWGEHKVCNGEAADSEKLDPRVEDHVRVQRPTRVPPWVSGMIRLSFWEDNSYGTEEEELPRQEAEKPKVCGQRCHKWRNEDEFQHCSRNKAMAFGNELDNKSRRKNLDVKIY